MTSYKDCRFFAEKTSARKNAELTGGVVIIATHPTEDHINGKCLMGLGTPKSGTRMVPCATWVSPDYLSRKCVEVSEADARSIAPEMFQALESFDRSPEFRTIYEIALREARERGRYSLQSAK